MPNESPDPTLEEFLSKLTPEQRASAEEQIAKIEQQLGAKVGVPRFGQQSPNTDQAAAAMKGLGTKMATHEVVVRNDQGQLVKHRVDAKTAKQVEELKAAGYRMVQLGKTTKQKKAEAKRAARLLQQAKRGPAEKRRLKQARSANRVERKRQRQRRRQSRLKGGAIA